MRQNRERRQALVDAGIEVLARDGMRGLTFRAVDAEADVPVGTASNYFANRDDLLTQMGGRVYERLQPAPGDDLAAVPGFAEALAADGPRERLTALMRTVVRRVADYRSGYLALLELRLEATRRPGLRDVLTATIRADIEANVAAHAASGLPGDTTTVELLHLALNWLILERLTLPEVFPAERLDALVAAAVERALPA
ncbi:TetR/AcrR family transcriptional regulator [Actinomadura kijaniata]|uniref:TetR/AcrR family transcriptional regulator n=1 Tax=Actinomadura kijaniata TaxID=46161 RepID=UPI003F199CF2